jgi:hypothetical protein
MCRISSLGVKNSDFCSLKKLQAPRKPLGSYKFCRDTVQETHAGYKTLEHAKMTTIHKSPKRLKDLECKREQLSSLPPFPYFPPTDLVATKESPNNLKIKLPDGTIFNMSIFSQGKTEEYLAHVGTVLCLINQKGLNVKCRKLAKQVDKLAGTLENLQKSYGPKGASSNNHIIPSPHLNSFIFFPIARVKVNIRLTSI